MKNYIVIDENLIVVSVLQSKEEIFDPQYIETPDYVPNVIGMMYVDGVLQNTEYTQNELTPSQEEITLDLLLETKYQTALLEMMG